MKYQGVSRPDFVAGLKKAISDAGHTPFCFVDEGYIDDEKIMMKRALNALEKSDILLIDTCKESYGVGIEAGYFHSLNRPIITIFHENQKTSRTLRGLSDHLVFYKDETDLALKLGQVLKKY